MKIYMANCKTEPFGFALKALGVMKIIGEQKDPDIESYWENGELKIRPEAVAVVKLKAPRKNKVSV